MTREEVTKYKWSYGIRIGAGFYLLYSIYGILAAPEAAARMQIDILISVAFGILGILFIVTGIKGFREVLEIGRQLDLEAEEEEQRREALEREQQAQSENQSKEQGENLQDRSSLLTFEEDEEP